MNPLEKLDQQENAMAGTHEAQEQLQPAIEVLEEVAAQFRTLDDEAITLIQVDSNATGWKEKLAEKAALIISLPDRLAEALGRIDDERTKTDIRDRVSEFTEEAQRAVV
jgi:hypothetical protein